MEEFYPEAFEAIQIFVEDLWEVFSGIDSNNLALYKRLMEKTEENDSERIKLIVDGFRDFLSSYEKVITDEKYEDLEENVQIRYSGSSSICIPIQYLISESDEEARLVIRQHLLTIGAIIDPNDEKYQELEKTLVDIGVDDGTVEGQFISNIMSKAQHTMEDVDMDNPGTAMMGLLSSGVINEMVSGLQQGVGSGSMDVGKLLGTMQAAMGAMMPTQEQNSPSIEEVEDKK